jgi:hypothetical protein
LAAVLVKEFSVFIILPDSIDEVIAQAFRFLEEDERHYQSWVEATSEKLAIGAEQADKGQRTTD